MEHDVAKLMDRNEEAHPILEHGLDFMNVVEETTILRGSDVLKMNFQIRHKEYDGTTTEYEGDRGENGEDNFEEVNQDDDGDDEDGVE